MKIKGLVDEDFCNYKKPSMFIIFPKCTWKCDKECGRAVCQNSALAKAPIYDIPIKKIIKRYKNNPITKAIVLGGLEPFDSLDELAEAVSVFRKITKDPIIIYTGYTKEELESGAIHDARENQECSEKYKQICNSGNIIIKYGRFIPDDEEHFDPILGIKLASRNQYAGRYK